MYVRIVRRVKSAAREACAETVRQPRPQWPAWPRCSCGSVVIRNETRMVVAEATMRATKNAFLKSGSQALPVPWWWPEGRRPRWPEGGAMLYPVAGYYMLGEVLKCCYKNCGPDYGNVLLLFIVPMLSFGRRCRPVHRAPRPKSSSRPKLA